MAVAQALAAVAHNSVSVQSAIRLPSVELNGVGSVITDAKEVTVAVTPRTTVAAVGMMPATVVEGSATTGPITHCDVRKRSAERRNRSEDSEEGFRWRGCSVFEPVMTVPTMVPRQALGSAPLVHTAKLS